MRRNHAILLSLILLLIGGGALAFHFHLRTRDIPRFSEVDAFMPALPEAMGWPPGTTRHEIKQDNILMLKNRWLSKIGIDTSKVQVTKFHFFSSIEQPNKTWVVSFRASDPGLEEVWERELDDMLVRADPADAENIRRVLLEKFPNLRHVLKVNPKLAPR